MYFLQSLFSAHYFRRAPLARNHSIPRRDATSQRAIDDAYTAKIKQYTTEPYFTSPLVNYLPASKTVPTPQAVLGDVAGAPGILPYAEDVYRYMRMLEKASPRVKVYSIGKTEEGREMIAVAVSSEENLKHLDEDKARLAKLADPRTIKLDDAEADKLVQASVPIYYITGTIHSTETGAPTALMELAYRLAVDESPYVQEIRNGVITLITPVVEVDGRDRMVDIYKWHLAHPGQNYPNLVYWGKYVAHDNNRDAMGVTLKLTENVLNTFVDWKAQVLHDLHESVPYLYDNTAGDGPFNAWVDPILTNEWEMLGWRNVADMTKFGMPGVFTHGNFDTWSPGYLMFIAAMHNGISRLYETFGNGGADTLERTLSPAEYDRTWYRQDPPLPKTLWSQRDNNNYEETGLLTSLHYFEDNRRFFLKNFYLKAKRSIQKPQQEGPAAYVLPGDDPRLGSQADLLRMMQKQSVEISRATAAFSVTLPAPKTRGGRGATGANCRPRRRTKRQDRTSQGEGRGEPSAAGGDHHKRISRRKLYHPHGPALFPDRGFPARLSILESRRSAEDSLRRYGLDVWRTFQRASGARDRSEGAGRLDAAGEGSARAGRGERHRNDFRDQCQCRPRAGYVALSLEERFGGRGRRSLSPPADTISIADRSLFTMSSADDLQHAAAELGIAGVCARCRAQRENASRARRSRGVAAHLAIDADRGLVARSAR